MIDIFSAFDDFSETETGHDFAKEVVQLPSIRQTMEDLIDFMDDPWEFINGLYAAATPPQVVGKQPAKVANLRTR